jgi:hypothetical protein
MELDGSAEHERSDEIALEVVNQNGQADDGERDTGPLAARATRAATAPETNEPTIGKYAPKNVSTASGSDSGTLRRYRPTPMTTR